MSAGATNTNEPKTAIITGASSGIGRETALTLAESGMAVVLQARRKERLNEVAGEIAAKGGKALAVAGDAGRPEDIDLLMEKALAWEDGRRTYDVVIVNAGRGLAGGIMDSDQSQWEDLYNVNVMGAAYLMRCAGKYMTSRKSGDIVVLSSVVGTNISPFSGFYGSSKFAVRAMAEGLRREVCADGVRVSTILPGIVLSEFQQVAGYDEENFGKHTARLGTLLEPKAIADGIAWLLSLPPHVNVNEMAIRPTGQDYP